MEHKDFELTDLELAKINQVLRGIAQNHYASEGEPVSDLILAHREVAPLLSDDHFSVDGTLVKAWASMKSFQPKATDTPPDHDPGSSPGPEATTEDG